MYFTRISIGPSIQEYIAYYKQNMSLWESYIYSNLTNEVAILGQTVCSQKLLKISIEEFENVFLDKWSHALNNEKEITKGLFSCGKFLLPVHGCI